MAVEQLIDNDSETNTSGNEDIAGIIQDRLDNPGRRGLFKGAAATAALSFIGASAQVLAAEPGTPGKTPGKRPARLGFQPVAKHRNDVVTVPEGYSATVLYRLGDPIAPNVPTYRNDGNDAAASFAWRAGDHHDAIEYFGLGRDHRNGGYSGSSSRGLLVVNHEAITPPFLHANGVSASGSGAAQVRTSPEEVLREFYVHGVSVVEVERGSGGWTYLKDSAFNRRIHTLTETAITGPAAGNAQMVTKYSPSGKTTRGTVNNCAHGTTPWHTYLTCEENFANYFRRTAADDARRSPNELASLRRYGVRGNGRELWATVTPDTPDNLYGRWNAEALGESAAEDYRNAPNTYGWVVEIDPYDPHSTPRKRTALGRFAHEGAWLGRVQAGKPLVWYSGDDARNEYIYKYVSDAKWDPADANKGIAAGDKYLDAGRLYAAKYNADGTGEWLELKHGSPALASSGYKFADQADVVINSRLAADAAGATRMDRPEWGAVDPVTGAVYMTLTNNNAALRPLSALDAANPRHYNDPRTAGPTAGNAQRGNPNGHIIRWMEAGNDPAATRFRWDIYLFAARAGSDPANVNLSALTADNDLSSPDGLWFSAATNICWIQTDDGAYTDVTNCMMLAALPGRLGDGGPKTITSSDEKGQVREVRTYVGAPPGDRLRRFLVGPVQCEITGVTETPDGRALFVNIQHPGENIRSANIGNPSAFPSHWPDGGMSRPRSATVVITKNDGGVIGL